MHRLIEFLFFFMCITSCQAVAPKTGEELEELIDEFVDPILVCRNLVGLNVAVVYQGGSVLTKGYGVTHLQEEALPVTDTTIFGIASVTKAFATTLLGVLLEEHES